MISQGNVTMNQKHSIVFENDVLIFGDVVGTTSTGRTLDDREFEDLKLQFLNGSVSGLPQYIGVNFSSKIDHTHTLSNLNGSSGE